MKSESVYRINDSRDMSNIDDDSVELVVTSPPYPMIEMWDSMYASLDRNVDYLLSNSHGDRAFEYMHRVLDAVWGEVSRVLVPGGIACVNVGDATRTLQYEFKRYHNRDRITESFTELGFTSLPSILWHKPTNSPTKFMGSGMLPPNAYVTQEHEHILIFRNGNRRQFTPYETRRYESAYFWEERNRWFSDSWTEITGRKQQEGQSRIAAFPTEIPYRLVNMFSVYGDTVLDPFAGTGTTGWVASLSGRNSILFDIEDYTDRYSDHCMELYMAETAQRRLTDHIQFVAGDDGTYEYQSIEYGIPVKTKAEKEIKFYSPSRVYPAENDEGITIEIEYDPLSFEF